MILIDKQENLKESIRQKAKEKQAEGGKNKVPQKSVEAAESRVKLAKLAGVSHDTYKKREPPKRFPKISRTLP